MKSRRRNARASTRLRSAVPEKPSASALNGIVDQRRAVIEGILMHVAPRSIGYEAQLFG
jgi:hypothetical protein